MAIYCHGCASLMDENKRLRAKLEKVATWLERNALIHEDFAERCKEFKALADDERANAKNYRATAADIRKALVA